MITRGYSQGDWARGRVWLGGLSQIGEFKYYSIIEGRTNDETDTGERERERERERGGGVITRGYSQGDWARGRVWLGGLSQIGEFKYYSIIEGRTNDETDTGEREREREREGGGGGDYPWLFTRRLGPGSGVVGRSESDR